MAFLRFIAVPGVMLMTASSAHASVQDDAYIAGYAAGVLKHDLKLDMPSLLVRDGVITLPVGSLEAADRAKAVQLLWEIPGVNAVKTSESTNQQRMSPNANAAQVSGDETGAAAESALLPTGLLPKGHLFKPLLADPRWAHFSAAYRNYQSNNFDGRDIAVKKRAKLSRVLGKRALKSFHPRLFNVRFLTGESWSVSNGRY
ncbi:MAG: DUF1207 domain-containing protein, partial [Methylobacter sp.]